MATEQDYWNQMYANACDQNEVLSLRQQLSISQKQIAKLEFLLKRKNHTLNWIAAKSTQRLVKLRANEALAASAIRKRNTK